MRFAIETDFPPFSFTTREGAAAGLSVELGQALCSDLALVCSRVSLPAGGLAAAIVSGTADAIFTPVKLGRTLQDGIDATRPIFRSAARFAVRIPNGLVGANAAALAGKRVAVTGKGSHADWLQRHFTASTAVPFASAAQAREALRTGAVDALFDDGLSLVFWIAGQQSRGCCELIPGSFYDDAGFSHPYAILVTANRPDLRRFLDHGLDRLQRSGRLAAIYRRYLPSSPW